MPPESPHHFLASESALAGFLSAFEQARLPGSAWTHAAHVAMAAVYLRRYGISVLQPTREAIQRFNQSVGGSPTAYHETLTILWLAVVAEFLETQICVTDLDAATLAVTALAADSKLHKLYYSFDVVKSEEARRAWLPPDLQPVAIHFYLPAYERSAEATPSLPAPASD